ncbi:MAG: glycosyltransferase family 4 protein [Planctomycetes bacterium]|nr:glycosyltransferase family 4 protein [Planctomycetota bacterium]
MSSNSLQVVYMTSGAAGMYCGSCLNDNTLARALMQAGVDIQLIPTYTPIRTDEPDVSAPRIFFGGINVYLEQKSRLYRALPTKMTRWLDNRGLLKWVTSYALSRSYSGLGPLTVSMLDGALGHQKREVEQLVDWLANHARPNVIHFSNLLIAGCIPEIRRRCPARIVVTLQGDDIFLDSLPEPYRSQATDRMRKLVPLVDLFTVHSRFYQSLMMERLSIPESKFARLPLTIDVTDYSVAPAAPQESGKLVLGYLARLAPEKGLGQLVEAFLRLKRQPGMGDVELRIAGWLGEQHRGYAETQFEKLNEGGLRDQWRYVGELDRRSKVEFLRGLDLFCVPATFLEPKGIYLLEALAAGVAVVAPAHGAFPELLAATRGGRLCMPNNVDDLAATLARLLANAHDRRQLAATGQAIVHAECNARVGAERLAKLYDVLRGSSKVG